MADIIRLLPDSVANQIAAGEVIQRPASVVKELVENSLDAGATEIKVYVIEAGKSCIQVVDNGKGMSETDARLAFERHATSKIKEAADLFALHTMGFRGEALASIAAVAQVELRTRTADNELGVCINIEGNKVTGQEPVACPVGANFKVNNLFFNVPARRKFLKANSTELSNVLTEFERIALAHPEVSFKFYNNETILLDLPQGNFRKRISGVFGRKTEEQTIPIKVETSLANIHGYVGIPESSKKKGAKQFFFANGRFMRHPYFAKAVQNAYERIIPENETIPYFVYFDVDPSRIDVNIHPAKTEIKFQDEQAIWQILNAAVRESLGKFNAIPTIDFDNENKPVIPTFPASHSNANVAQPEIQINKDFNPFDDDPTEQPSYGNHTSHPSRVVTSAWSNAYDMATERTANKGEASLYDDAANEEKEKWEKANAEYIQYKGRFIVTSVKSGLMLIDQHRADIRILYDNYKHQLENQKAPSQQLLFPQMIELPQSQAAILENNIQELSNVGFSLSNLGGGTYSINGVPAQTEGIDPSTLLQSIISDPMLHTSKIKEEIHHAISLRLAQKVALPIGQYLNTQEMENIVEKLFLCPDPVRTPDGKPVLTILKQESIEDMFS